jgi:hypothetical protein
MFAPKESFSKLVLVCSTVSFALMGADSLQAQLFAKAKADFAKIKADFSNDAPIQYSPSDPRTKSRLFNLQTGQAGAFYNCDGEEDKRCSPYICWKTGCGDRFHRTFWDVLNWKKDRAEIAQRICDGAGACCSGGSSCNTCQQSAVIEVAPQTTSGCSSCVAASPKVAKPVSSKQRALVSTPSKAKSGLQDQPAAVAGLVEADETVRSVMESQGIVKVAPCDCYACRMERRKGAETETTTSKTASLIDRARFSRKQR